MSDDASTALEAARQLDAWITGNGWAGYDPYDLRGHKLLIRAQRAATAGSLPGRAAWRGIRVLEQSAPLLSRHLFRVGPTINAKGMALLARGYLDLFRRTEEPVFRHKAVACLEWLLSNATGGYKGLSWGYPFDWQSRVFIPRGTPSGVVTSTAGDAFWAAHLLLGDAKWMDACLSICDFFTSSLRKAEPYPGTICFSYTPIDEFQVHNANLMVGEFLARVGDAVGRQDLVELGQKAGAFAVAEQNADGSIYYWSRAQTAGQQGHLDHYHTGFEIRALFGLYEHTGQGPFLEAAQRYHAFYLERCFLRTDAGMLPKRGPHSVYPVDIHACAEALLCNLRVMQTIPGARAVLPDTLRWTLRKMRRKDGAFCYQIRRQGRREVRDCTPYLRWGQAWMLAALGAYVSGMAEA